MEINRCCVLLADDELNDVVLFKLAFNSVAPNDRLAVVRDGNEAIAYLAGDGDYSDREEHPLPEYVVFDVKMPRVSGFEAISWVKSQGHLRFLPIIMFSSSERPQDIHRAYELGANGYITKPVRHEDLIMVVKAIHGFWKIARKV